MRDLQLGQQTLAPRGLRRPQGVADPHGGKRRPVSELEELDDKLDVNDPAAPQLHMELAGLLFRQLHLHPPPHRRDLRRQALR